MKIFFTSDCHFNHANIIKYCNRPFYKESDLINGHLIFTSEEQKRARAGWMNQTIIENWNNLVSPDDLVFHVGDFSFGNSDTILELEKQLNGKIIHIEGNHDRNNGTKSYLISAILHFGGKSILMKHHPPRSISEIPRFIDFVICGHVHTAWKHKIIDNIPIINVGVDMWNFTPISTESLLKYYRDVKGEMYRNDNKS